MTVSKQSPYELVTYSIYTSFQTKRKL